MKRDFAKQVERMAGQDKMYELTLEDLDAAVGGKGAGPSSPKLFEAGCTGKHIPKVTIEL